MDLKDKLENGGEYLFSMQIKLDQPANVTVYIVALSPEKMRNRITIAMQADVPAGGWVQITGRDIISWQFDQLRKINFFFAIEKDGLFPSFVMDDVRLVKVN